MRTAIAAILLALSVPAYAREPFDRHAIYSVGSEATTTERAVRKVRAAGLKQIRRKHQRKAAPRSQAKHPYAGHSASLDAVTPQLAAKAREIMAACDAKVISAYRPGARVRGYGVPSLHSRYPAEAIDMVGDTSCIYPKLKGWAGGYSVDYAAVRHVHISLASDRRERGARFVHYGTRRYARASR